jgi:hypothetical protein
VPSSLSQLPTEAASGDCDVSKCVSVSAETYPTIIVCARSKAWLCARGRSWRHRCAPVFGRGPSSLDRRRHVRRAAAVTSHAKPERSHAGVANSLRVDRRRPTSERRKPIESWGLLPAAHVGDTSARQAEAPLPSPRPGGRDCCRRSRAPRAPGRHAEAVPLAVQRVT